VERKTAARVAWGLVAMFVVLAGVALWLQVLTDGWASSVDDFVFVPIFAAFGIVGALVASAQPRNAVGWVFVGISASVGLAFFTDTYARYSLMAAAEPLPGTAWMAWVSGWLWVGAFGPALTFLPLLFPDGRLPSRRWRPVAWMAGTTIAVSAFAFALQPGEIEGYGIANPLGVEALEGAAGFMDGAGFVGIVVLSVAAAASLILRYRRAGGDRRRQIKWFAFAVSVVAGWAAISAILEALEISNPIVDTALSAVAFVSLPVGVGIGILRHRLFDIEVVLNRTVLFGLLAAFVTALYVGIVVGIGAAIGSRGNLFLSIVATALIAVLFHPIRERARRLADRIVYGKRATPYEVLSEFSDRMGGSYASEDVLQRMARVVGEGTGARRAEVWLRVGSGLRRSAAWPAAEGGLTVPLRGDELPEIEGADRAYAVRDGGELLGALSIDKPPGEPLTPAEDRLLADLAAQAGLVLRNVRLIEELRASRQRLVAAQDEERRRLERNIHDGAQQQLVALAVKMNLVEALAGKDPAKAAAMAAQAKAELQQALDDLRDLARGIYPPLLADKGLAVALESQARKAAIPVTVDPDGIGRYPQEAEAAAYFCVLEALQNAAKYADASRVEVRLSQDDGHLGFTVTDDGRGFDPATIPPGSGLQNMADRLEALGGRVQVTSTPGRGTMVTGRIPVEDR